MNHLDQIEVMVATQGLASVVAAFYRGLVADGVPAEHAVVLASTYLVQLTSSTTSPAPATDDEGNEP